MKVRLSTQNQMENQGEIVLYQPNEEIKLEVRLEGETVWLNRQQMSQLFGRDIKTIGKHINNASHEELDGMATIAKFATVKVSTFSKSHDRFLIIDDKVYLIGASIKDLGKRWFAFTELGAATAEDLLSKLHATQ